VRDFETNCMSEEGQSSERSSRAAFLSPRLVPTISMLYTLTEWLAIVAPPGADDAPLFGQSGTLRIRRLDGRELVRYARDLTANLGVSWGCGGLRQGKFWHQKEKRNVTDSAQLSGIS